MSTDRKVVIRGIVCDYEAKAPFVVSGRSLQGALELSGCGAKLKCHECGHYHGGLGNHVAKTHGLTARDYRAKHGLRSTARLIAPSVKRKANTSGLRPQGKRGVRPSGPRQPKRPQFEDRNLRGTCLAQLKARVLRVAEELGRTPTWVDLQKAGIPPTWSAGKFGVAGIDELMRACGLEPNGNRTNVRYSGNQRLVLIELLRDAYVNLGRPLRASDCKAPLLPSRHTIQRYFGSWQIAIDQAGLGLTSTLVS